MLLRFRTANVRSLRDEQELSFVVSDDEPSLAGRPIELAGSRSLSVLPLIGIFGANASGKSNVLAAMTSLRDPYTDVFDFVEQGMGVTSY